MKLILLIEQLEMTYTYLMLCITRLYPFVNMIIRIECNVTQMGIGIGHAHTPMHPNYQVLCETHVHGNLHPSTPTLFGT